MSSPSDRTHRVYGVSFSAANFFAKSSETTASFDMLASAHGGGAGAAQVAFDAVRRQYHCRVVLRRILDLFQVIQSARLEDAVDDRDEARGLVGTGVEVLVDGVVPDVDDVH